MNEWRVLGGGICQGGSDEFGDAVDFELLHGPAAVCINGLATDGQLCTFSRSPKCVACGDLFLPGLAVSRLDVLFDGLPNAVSTERQAKGRLLLARDRFQLHLIDGAETTQYVQ